MGYKSTVSSFFLAVNTTIERGLFSVL
uniref:Uncharacterized protein n=1 Tax=Arundo donax TaxID=35708 RepID=A0A0A8YJZ6_ARUDO